MKIARKHIMQTVEAAMEIGGTVTKQFKHYSISVSMYYQGRKCSGVRVVWEFEK